VELEWLSGTRVTGLVEFRLLEYGTLLENYRNCYNFLAIFKRKSHVLIFFYWHFWLFLKEKVVF
jgi:hypothetical protein